MLTFLTSALIYLKTKVSISVTNIFLKIKLSQSDTLLKYSPILHDGPKLFWVPK